MNMNMQKRETGCRTVLKKTDSMVKPQTVVERRSAEAQVRELIDQFAPAHGRLITLVRRLLRKRLPSAYEIVYQYRSWFVISFSPSEKGYLGVLALRADAQGVKLYFHQGKELQDPEKLLRGTANTRWIHVENATMLARPAVVRLIDEAITHHHVPFQPTGQGSIIIRSATIKKRNCSMATRRS